MHITKSIEKKISNVIEMKRFEVLNQRVLGSGIVLVYKVWDNQDLRFVSYQGDPALFQTRELAAKCAKENNERNPWDERIKLWREKP